MVFGNLHFATVPVVYVTAYLIIAFGDSSSGDDVGFVNLCFVICSGSVAHKDAELI